MKVEKVIPPPAEVDLCVTLTPLEARCLRSIVGTATAQNVYMVTRHDGFTIDDIRQTKDDLYNKLNEHLGD